MEHHEPAKLVCQLVQCEQHAREVVLNFGVNNSWERNASTKEGLEIDLNHPHRTESIRREAFICEAAAVEGNMKRVIRLD